MNNNIYFVNNSLDIYIYIYIYIYMNYYFNSKTCIIYRMVLFINIFKTIFYIYYIVYILVAYILHNTMFIICISILKKYCNYENGD